MFGLFFRNPICGTSTHSNNTRVRYYVLGRHGLSIFISKIPDCKYKHSKQLWLLFNTTKSDADFQLNPYVHKSYNCTAMILVNLADPQWVSVRCTEHIANIVYCFSETSKQTCFNKWDFLHSYYQTNHFVCVNNSTKIGNRCHYFLWTSLTSAQNILTNQTDPKTDLKVLFDTMSEMLPPIFAENFTKIFVYVKCSKTVGQIHEAVHSSSVYALVIEKGEAVHISPKRNLFSCSGGAFIAMCFMCDGWQDCPHGGVDEEGCECKKTKSYSKKCKYLVDQSGKKSCSMLFSITMKRDCHLQCELPREQTSDQEDRKVFAPGMNQIIQQRLLNCSTDFGTDNEHTIAAHARRRDSCPVCLNFQNATLFQRFACSK